MMVLSIVATIVLIGALFYHRVNLLLSSAILLALTAAWSFAHLWTSWLLIPLAIILLPFNLLPTRRALFSKPMLRSFQKVMPPMSRTEKEAIDAGTTWWEGDLFRGTPDWEKLHNYPQPRLTEEEQVFLDGPVEEACRMANDFQITHEIADLPPELWAYLKEHRFFAMIIKKEYDGLAFSAYAQARVLQKLAGVSGILAPIATVLGLALMPTSAASSVCLSAKWKGLRSRWHVPSDSLDYQLAKILQIPSATRTRLGRGMYLKPGEHNPAGQLEEALAVPPVKQAQQPVGKADDELRKTEAA